MTIPARKVSSYIGERKPFYRVHFESLFWIHRSIYIQASLGSYNCMFIDNYPIGHPYVNSLNNIENSSILSCLTSDSV